MKIESEIGVMSAKSKNTKNCQYPPETEREIANRFSLRNSRKKQSYQYLDFRLVTSRTM